MEKGLFSGCSQLKPSKSILCRSFQWENIDIADDPCFAAQWNNSIREVGQKLETLKAHNSVDKKCSYLKRGSIAVSLQNFPIGASLPLTRSTVHHCIAPKSRPPFECQRQPSPRWKRNVRNFSLHLTQCHAKCYSNGTWEDKPSTSTNRNSSVCCVKHILHLHPLPICWKELSFSVDSVLPFSDLSIVSKH